ncbi:hypothetical protein JIQ42_06841 [Leishmania sp. Namibia]|uniref:hypothetical protein n=1 Tax=Leishmania sp. Namibia TaxID=2802991 RepID=UPI001B77A6BB|nr:hypothetical protein JIQ42_06841 [Leishmania sp. Namibia]
MLRGVSLVPQQRGVKGPQELPSELKNALLGGPTYKVPPDYGSAGGSGADLVLVSSPLLSRRTGDTPKRPSRGRAPSSLVSRLFRAGEHRYSTGFTGQVPVFDYDGRLTTRQIGVNTFRFRSLSLFYFFRSQPWMALIAYSIVLYLIIVLLIAAVYYAWGMVCGAGMNVVSAIYFTVVSLAANGGYMGEDGETMTDATHVCYRGRTAIVMVCSYVNIVFVGLVAALVVSKAEYAGKLGHRVVFSDFCTLASIPGRVDQWRLVFRIANVDNHIPLALGKLRLFCVTAEPLKEYHIRQQLQHQALQHSNRGKWLAKSMWGSIHQLLPGMEPDGGSGGRQQQQMAVPTAEVGDNRRDARARMRRAKGRNQRYSAPAPLASHDSARSGSREDKGELARAQRHERRRTQRNQQPRKSGTGDRTEANSSGRQRGRRSGGPPSLQQSQGVRYTESQGDRSASSGSSRSLSNASLSSDTYTLSTSAASSGLSSGSGVSSTGARRKTLPGDKASSQSRLAADKTDSANLCGNSKEKISLGASSSVAETRSAPSSAAAGKRSQLPIGIPEPAVSVPMQRHFPDEDGGNAMQRVHLCVEEMRWTCAGETYLDRGESGQLSLWYPAEIIHIIDERSPLHPFLEPPHVAASLCSGGSSAEVPCGLACRADIPQRHFQIVAVFDATEMESGSAITAKRTYTTENIVAHYRFSDRLVHMHPETNEVLLDFHYFNALLPMSLVEPSTTDSDM